jgi:putative dimethyl sulfoxide reductase chaperone
VIEEQDSLMERARGEVYGFFSALFLNQPTPEMLARVLDKNGANVWDELFPQHPACARLRELSQAYRRGEWQADDFLLDYEALFRVPGDRYVHPFESVYRQQGFSAGKAKTCAVLAEQAREVASIYREQGLAPREGFTEFPDHLGVELELMAVVCRKTAEALEKGNQENAARSVSQQRAFLAHHLLQWGTDCLDKVREKGQTPFYTCLADLLKTFLEEQGDLEFSSSAGDVGQITRKEGKT